VEASGATIVASDPEVASGDGPAIEHKGTIVVDSKVERQRKVDKVERRRSDRDFYALVDKRGKHINSQGSLDMAAIDSLKKLPDGQALWFRRDGREYLVTDPAVLARAHAAWREAEAIGAKMEPLGEQMERYGERMEALGEQMEALSENHRPTERMRAAQKQMRELGRQQRELGRQQGALEDRIEAADEDPGLVARLEREAEALADRMDELARRMDDQADIMDQESSRMDENAKPMEELGRQMDLASKPMDELGRQMDALGKQMDVASAKAERATHAIIDEAMAKNLARPVNR
jgi:DNA repair exonuclease SbcCD ATPase subunit